MNMLVSGTVGGTVGNGLHTIGVFESEMMFTLAKS